MNTSDPIVDSYLTPVKKYTKGIGDAVANRTYNRNIDGYREDWEDVAFRASTGSALLQPDNFDREFHRLHHHMRQGSCLMAGRHLQHGDEHQPERNLEVYCNCATAATSFQLFYLLLNGSGVGRAYDDALMVIDWHNMPTVVPVCRQDHPDVLSKEIHCMDLSNVENVYAHKKCITFSVSDSREGWAQAIELLECMAYEGTYRDHVLIFDFSNIRARGNPIRGMQNRPASGPGPTMKAIESINRIRDTNMPRWKQTMYVDHYLAESVLVGGIRRAARMSTKTWKDESVLDFVAVKQGGFLWTSNNSVTVDEDFWGGVRTRDSHAITVLSKITRAAYHDGTGEPGIINQHLLTQKGPDSYPDNYMSEEKYSLITRDEKLQEKLGYISDGVMAEHLMKCLSDVVISQKHRMITNPCGEISLLTLGGFCVIGDVVPYHAKDDDDAEDAFRVCARALMRVNLMPSMYDHEVKRTNRIGVGITGIHEYAWKRFGFGFRDLINEEKSQDFWMMLSRFKRAVVEECETYSKELGQTVPHTNTTVKPSGTVSKLFNLSEGVHLPSKREYLRWVQYRDDNPVLKQFKESDHPIRKLQTYKDTTIVGFPTRPEICKLGMGDKLVIASEATPEEQFKWLTLLEKYWIKGVNEDGSPMEETGNQVSYTLKYNPNVVSYEEFRDNIVRWQSRVRACAVLPEVDISAYEYNPEQPISIEEYDELMHRLNIPTEKNATEEDVDRTHVDCASGACPIEFKEK